MTISVVLGNGISRKQLTAKLLNGKNTYACNYAYKDFDPKNLIVCDRHLLITALSEGANKKAKVWTRHRWYNNINSQENLYFFPNLPFEIDHKYDRDMNWGSGTYAAYLACLDEPNVLVLVGFDLWANNNKVNNIYAGQNGYGPADASPVDPSAWIYQFKKLFAHFNHKQFVFLNTAGWQLPKEWNSYKNVFFDDIREFKKL